MLVRPNVLVTVGRAVRGASGKSAPAPQAPLPPIAARLKVLDAAEYKKLPAAAVGSEYVLFVDAAADIRAGDLLLRVVLLRDGATPWPDFRALADPDQAAAGRARAWKVKLARRMDPGPRPFKKAYVARMDTGGPSGE